MICVPFFLVLVRYLALAKCTSVLEVVASRKKEKFSSFVEKTKQKDLPGNVS